MREIVLFSGKNLHSWNKFYTTAGRDGRDKSQLCDHDDHDDGMIQMFNLVIAPENVASEFFSPSTIFCRKFSEN